MHEQQDPVINNWYTNLTGKLFKVRMASYGDGGVVSLVIEYIDGSKQIISRQEWDCLKLMSHNTYRNKKEKNLGDQHGQTTQSQGIHTPQEELTH